MFSYTVKVNQLPRPLGKFVGFASLVIDDVLEVNGFRIINGQKGLFVSPPQHKGKGKDENGNEVDKWYDDVRFIGEQSEDVSKEIKESRVLVPQGGFIPRTEWDILVLVNGDQLFVDYFNVSDNGIQFRMEEEDELLTLPLHRVRSLTSRMGDVIYPKPILYKR